MEKSGIQILYLLNNIFQNPHQDQDMAGHTNLGFEPTEIETVISKATDLKTLSKNLDSHPDLEGGGDENETTSSRIKKSSKKKKFQSTSSSTGRIKNDLTVDVHSG